VHGYLHNSTDMTNLANAEQTQFVWTTLGLLPSYQSYLITVAIPPQGVVGAAKTKVDPVLLASGLIDLVAVGYSAGGLVSRSETHFDPAIIKGIVTIDAPNSGALLASWTAQNNLAMQGGFALGEIVRGPKGLGAQLSIDIATLLVSPLVVGLTASQALLNGFLADMSPGSTYLNTINDPAGAPQAIEQNLTFKGGKVAEVFGIQSSPKLPAMIDFPSGQTNYRALIQAAKDNANNYVQTAERINSGKHWWQFWKFNQIVYNLCKSIDWLITAQGYSDMNLAWKKNTDGLTPSDAFIAQSSQLGDPACLITNQFQLRSDANGNTSHIVANQNPTGSNNFVVIHNAMTAAGAIGL